MNGCDSALAGNTSAHRFRSNRLILSFYTIKYVHFYPCKAIERKGKRMKLALAVFFGLIAAAAAAINELDPAVISRLDGLGLTTMFETDGRKFL